MFYVIGWIIDVTGIPNIPLFVFAVCQTLGGAMLTLDPFVQRLSRDRKQQNNTRVVEEARKMIENEKAKESSMCIENGRLSVPKSPIRGINGNHKL